MPHEVLHLVHLADLGLFEERLAEGGHRHRRVLEALGAPARHDRDGLRLVLAAGRLGVELVEAFFFDLPDLPGRGLAVRRSGALPLVVQLDGCRGGRSVLRLVGSEHRHGSQQDRGHPYAGDAGEPHVDRSRPLPRAGHPGTSRHRSSPPLGSRLF